MGKNIAIDGICSDRYDLFGKTVKVIKTGFRTSTCLEKLNAFFGSKKNRRIRIMVFNVLRFSCKLRNFFFKGSTIFIKQIKKRTN